MQWRTELWRDDIKTEADNAKNSEFRRFLRNTLPKTAKQLRKICKEKTAQEESIFMCTF